MADQAQKMDETTQTARIQQFAGLVKDFYNAQMNFARLALNPDSALAGASAGFSRTRTEFTESYNRLAEFCADNAQQVLMPLLELSLARQGGSSDDKAALQRIKKLMEMGVYSLSYSSGDESPGRVNLCVKTKTASIQLFYFYYVEGGDEETGSAAFFISDDIKKLTGAAKGPLTSVPRKS
jgi:hypothetical protein